MRKLVSLLNNRWVLGIIGILALSLLIWFGADYIKFGANNKSLSETARLIIIISIFLIWLIGSLIKWGFEQRQNKHMVEELKADEATANPDQERSAEEIKLINDRFKDALSVLTKSRFSSSSGNKSLYQLPWYMIIGPPGSGKTTALVNSGLNFPLAQSHGTGALGGIGGTRHCDWWFTNEAVLIDTAGRYTTQDSHRVVDSSSWQGFLKLLKRYRPRRPLNGVIIAISLHELIVQTIDQRKHHAKTIRSRIDELQDQLGLNFPVYLMFTKCDLVAGFSEFFSNLSQAEREQVWGMTFPLDEQTQNYAELFKQQYTQLVQRLNHRLLWRIDTERNVDARALMQGFPNRMDTLADNLQAFIAETFAVNTFKTTPMLRGVYFSSATQEGSPIDRMMAAISVSFNLPRSVTAAQAGTGKSYFLNRLINDVIFAESELVGTNRTVESFLLWGRRLSFAALGVTSFILLIIWIGTVTRNKIFMNDVSESITLHQEAVKKIPVSNRNIVATLPVLNPLRTASKVYDKNEHPWLTGFGLYDGRVDVAAKNLYQSKLSQYFLPAYRRTMESELGQLTAQDLELPNTLGAYIMLSDKQHQDNQTIVTWAEQHWQKKYKGSVDQQQYLLGHLQTLLSKPLPISEPDPRVLSRARKQLSRIPVSQRLYKQLQRANNSPVDLYQQIGGDSQMVFGLSPDSPVFSTPILFTKTGFNDVDYGINSDLITKLERDRWIYGEIEEQKQYGKAERKELSEKIERAYLTDYSRNWKEFLQKLNIAPFNDLTSAVDTLQLLSDPSYSPLLTTLELTTENTQLRPALINEASESKTLAADVIPKGLKPTVVDKEFRDIHRLTKSIKNRPPALQDALNAIGELKQFMDEIASENRPGEAAYKVAKARFSGSGNNPIQQLSKLAVRSPEPIKHWLEQVADHSWVVLLSETSRYISEEWNQQVYYVFEKNLANRYPLIMNGNEETPLSVFNNFIGPSGVEQTFFKNYLQPFINSRKWQLQFVDGRSLSISAEAMRQLQRADRLRQAYYLNNSDNMVFTFRLKPLKLDAGIKRFTLEFANTRLNYSHGPQISKKVNWTSGEDERVRLLFEDLNGDMHRNQFTGDWAWLRLLDASRLSRGSNSSNFNATFRVGSRKAQYQLTATTTTNPFNTKLLRGYRCPQRL